MNYVFFSYKTSFVLFFEYTLLYKTLFGSKASGGVGCLYKCVYVHTTPEKSTQYLMDKNKDSKFPTALLLCFINLIFYIYNFAV